MLGAEAKYSGRDIPIIALFGTGREAGGLRVGWDARRMDDV